MLDQPSPDIELLRAAYAAFNARDIDATLATIARDVAWPKALKGGFAPGHQEVRDGKVNNQTLADALVWLWQDFTTMKLPKAFGARLK